VKRYGLLRRPRNGPPVLVCDTEDWVEATTKMRELSEGTGLVHLIYDFNVGAVVARSSRNMASMLDSLVAHASATSR